jgi:hypothetical protein
VSSSLLAWSLLSPSAGDAEAGSLARERRKSRAVTENSSGRQGFPGVEPDSYIGSAWGKLQVGGDPIKDR